MSSESNDKNPRPGLLPRVAGNKMVVSLYGSLNVWAYRLSGGRLMNKIDGTPVCLLTMTGRKSGKRKTIALMYTAVGDQVLLVASYGGSPTHPVWYHNLKANPEIDIQVGDRIRRMIAHEASGEERERLWPLAVANFPAFAKYQAKTARTIPVMVCDPAG